ncbi:putative recB protein [Mycobacterium xenopi 4042]|uniref:Putative recB protein n=1 Tax=Mycobacterium xenopi 4042 TaxID=1299334 RepID=X8C8T2_MYCXE|nr:putative recB protein [Mycobacterium xenopi 4042]
MPMHDTPLGPLAAGLTLRQIGAGDRLRELDFEMPMASGDLRDAAPEVWVRDVGELLRSHLPAGDPLAPYAERLTSAPLAHQSLRGYLTGSIDVVLRIPGPRYLLADYKTNRLGDTAADYSAARLAEAMLHSDYPLQALLYVVVLHRFLRWRQPGYDPGPISVGCCTCSCGACADPTHPGAACSGGGRRPSWWWRFPTCSTPGDRPHDRHRSRYRPHRSAAHVQAGRCAGRRGCACGGTDLRTRPGAGRAGGAGRGSFGARAAGRVGVRRPGGGRLDRRR